MKVGLFSIVDTYSTAVRGSGANRYSSLVDLGVKADRAGLDSIWVGEHHFDPSAGCPAPAVLLAAVGARTESIRLGSLVCVLPFHRPIEIAEQYALLDQLTHGRLNFGVGSGYVPLELEAFGILGSQKRARFDSALGAILTAFAGGSVSCEGRDPVRLNVLPVQRPYPPVWVAVQRREAMDACARNGISIAALSYASFSNLETLDQSIASYRRNLPDGIPRSVAVVVPTYIGQDPGRALRAFGLHLQSRPALQSGYFQDGVKLPPHPIRAERIVESGLAMFGAEDSVFRQMDRFRRIGVDYLLGMVDFGGLTPEESERSLKGLGEYR